MRAIIDEEKTEFHAGKTIYTVTIEIPKQENQLIQVDRDTVYDKLSCEKNTHPVLASIARGAVKDYLAKINSQGDY